MKKSKLKNVIQDLAEDFTSEFNSKIPIKTFSNGDIVYKDYLIKQDKKLYWSVFYIPNKELLHDFFLKSCALMAAKEYDALRFQNYQRLIHLDNRYQSHYSDSVVYKHNVKKITDYDQLSILLTKLEESQVRAKEYQHQISIMFKVSFCINTL